jgi:hypothetical protein
VGRIAAGWHLAKLSLRVVMSDASLTALVVLGGIAAGAVGLSFLVRHSSRTRSTRTSSP